MFDADIDDAGGLAVQETFDTVEIPTKKDRPTNNYVDKALLNAALREWQTLRKIAKEQGADQPPLPEYAAKSIIEIATNLSKKWNFRGYSFRDDMVGDAILNVLKYIGNYDPNGDTRSGEPNPFWYITIMCTNTFKFRIGNEERQQYYKMAVVGHMADDLISDEDFTSSLPNGTTSAREMFQDMQSKASSYEEKQFDKKAAKKEKAIQDAIDEADDETFLLAPTAQVEFSLVSIFI